MRSSQIQHVFGNQLRHLSLALLLSITALAAFAYGTDRSGATGDDGGPIKVGVIVPLSGRLSSFGRSTANGAEMAADAINRAGGINGRRVELIIEDDRGLPEHAARIATKLIKEDKVHALLGEAASSNSLAAASVAQRFGVPMVSPSSTSPRVTQVGNFIFRVCFIDQFQGEVMAEFAVKTLKAKRAAILFVNASEYSRGLSNSFQREFIRRGGRIVQKQHYSEGDTDFMGQLVTIRAAKPDFIYVPGYYQQVGMIAKQAEQIRINKPLLGGDGWDAPQLWEFGGRALDGSYMSTHYSAESPLPVVKKFVADYEANYPNSAPDAIAALGYDAMSVLADAIRRAGSTDNQRVRGALSRTRNFAGVTGTITINAARNAVKPAVVLELKDGEFIYKETIHPSGGKIKL